MSQMDDHDLDQLGRMAAAHTRAEARAMADSPSALRELLARESAAPSAEPAVVPVAPTRAVERPRWKLAAVAAAVGVLALGLGWALVNGFGGTIDIVAPAGTGPGLPGGDGTTPGTTPSGTGAPASTQPPSSPATSTVTSSVSSSVSSPTESGAPSTSTPATGPTSSIAPMPPFTGFEVPQVERPQLIDVPLLLPASPIPPENTYLAESASQEDAPLSLSQLWVRAAADGTVDAVLHLGTRIAPTFEQPNGEPIEVSGWDSARSYASVDGIVILELSAPEGVVGVWSQGLTADETEAIAATLRADGAGWTAPTLQEPGWVAVDATWTRGNAIRGLTTLSPGEGDVDTSLDISVGLSMFDGGGVIQLDAELQLVDVNGDQALLRRDGVSALAVKRSDGVLVRFGSRDPDADLVRAARSLAPVDQATWEAASQPWPAGADGCIGLFC